MKVGDVINEKYEVVRKIGEGGMGAIFEGRQLRITKDHCVAYVSSCCKGPELSSRLTGIELENGETHANLEKRKDGCRLLQR